MPVQKFKSFEDAEKALWNYEPDDAYFQRVRRLFEFAEKLNPIRCPHGIFKFKTIEEANRHREKWMLEQADRKRFRQKTATPE